MKVFWTCITLLGVAIVATLTVFAPQILGKNQFLQGFVTYEIMSFLIVILTITFASVANVHLSIKRTQAMIADPRRRQNIERNFAGPLRRETMSSAWLLFWGLIVVALALAVKGQFPEALRVASAVNGVAVLVLIVNAVVLYDIYSTVFTLVGMDDSGPDESPPA